MSLDGKAVAVQTRNIALARKRAHDGDPEAAYQILLQELLRVVEKVDCFKLPGEYSTSWFRSRLIGDGFDVSLYTDGYYVDFIFD